MDHLVAAIRQSVASECWYGALALALSAPSVCGFVLTGRDRKERYEAWFDDNVGPLYRVHEQAPASPEEIAWNAEYVRRHALGVDLGEDRLAFLQSHQRLPPRPLIEVQRVSGSDVYQLRCALLHEGSDDLTDKKATALDSFVFSPPDRGNIIHGNLVDGPAGGAAMQLQIDIFASQIADAVETWYQNLEQSPEVSARLERLLRIRTFGA